jgi:hypothetical protein
MKKTVWTFGLISGAIAALMGLATVSVGERVGFDKALIIGYTTMVVSGLLIYFGIRSYRDNANGGVVSFGRALAVGLLITAVSAVCYTAAWELIGTRLYPDFNANYEAHMIEKAKSSGHSRAEIDKQVAEAHKYADMYKNPLINTAMTFLEPLPVGLLIALISAGILRRKREEAV